MHRDITADELAARLGSGDEPFVLDVRQPAEVAEWAIPGAVNVPLGDLAHRVEALPVDHEIVVVCASGNRSAKASAYLARQGLRVANLRGGMAAWGATYDRVVVQLDGEVQLVQVRRRGKGCLS